MSHFMFALLVNFSNCSRLKIKSKYTGYTLVLFYIKLSIILEDKLLECKVPTIHNTNSSKTLYRQNCNKDINFNLSVEKYRTRERTVYEQVFVSLTWNSKYLKHPWNRFKVIQFVRVVFVWRKNCLIIGGYFQKLIGEIWL